MKKIHNDIISSEGSMFLIDKPPGYTSARVVNIVKKYAHVTKAGHCGTLDPRATGLLIICTGRKTRELSNFLNADKEYEGVMEIGSVTDSFDSETAVRKTASTDHITTELINETARSFIGETEQIPPMYSAVKYKGKPLYRLARKGVEIERPKRKVVVKKFDITYFRNPEIGFRILCSKGTYIRSIINDFGLKLGTGAYLKELRRTKIGNMDVKDSVTVDEFIRMYSPQKVTG